MKEKDEKNVGFNRKRAEGNDKSSRPKDLKLKARKLYPVNTISYVQMLDNNIHGGVTKGRTTCRGRVFASCFCATSRAVDTKMDEISVMELEKLPSAHISLIGEVMSDWFIPAK
ncbi:hypothetical protein Tco_1512528 [Tanacetum coccineum]